VARHLYVAGVERWRDYERGTLQIETALTYQVDTCRFQIRGSRPLEGEEVIIEDDGVGRLFAGIINRVELVQMLSGKVIKMWRVEAEDYTALLDRKLVVETYENKPADEIFLDIAAKYCPDFTTSGVSSGTPEIENTGAEFEYKRPSECFRWLCDYIGWHWEPDYYKNLHFFSAEELAASAPMALLTPGGRFRLIKHSVDSQGLRNRVYVCGGTMLSDPQTLQWRANGTDRIWMLPWPPHDVSLSIDGVKKTVGVENLHSEAEFNFMMNFNEKYIRCSALTATPTDGAIMTFTASQDIPVITMVENRDSQQAIAQVQGGDGIYEHVIADKDLVTLDAAEAAGEADLREHANPRVSGSFETEVNGWRPGQIVKIHLPERGIDNDYLVQRVTITPTSANPSIWTYRVDYGGRLIGIADYLKALISTQQQVITPALMNKFKHFEEAFPIQDLMFYIKVTTPYTCGQASARCGFTVCSS